MREAAQSFNLSDHLPTVLLIAGGLIVLIILLRNIRIVPQAEAWVITRMGVYRTTWTVGMHMKAPFIDSVFQRISLKERVLDYPPQPVITKDNVTMHIDAVVYMQVTDPKLYIYGIENPALALETLTNTTLRNIIGELELDQCLTSRDVINAKMRSVLDEATDMWGIRVTRVELQNIDPPQDVKDSMERQMKAERERRENILRAEGEKKAAILQAEGEKESAILRAAAEKEAAILKATARRESQILEAEGQAEAIRKVQQATADGLKMLNEACPSDSVLKLRAMEAFAAAADGRATKIIIPSEIQGLVGLASGVAEAAGSPRPKPVTADEKEG